MSRIPVECFSTLESTSVQAHQLLHEGRRPPFAVVAHKQTGGRGRRGHVWESPAGNIYVSIVLDATGMAIEKAGWLPLQMAAICASWIEKRFGVSLTIKWPNDLLYGGSKLGGILCESAVKGDQMAYLIVGIGINVAHQPDLKDQNQSVTTLSAVVGETLEFEPLALELVDAVVKGWSEWSHSRTEETFQRYALTSGQPVIDRHATPPRLAFIESVDRLGRLHLRHALTEATESLTSVHHGYRWLYQTPAPMLLLDAGNSKAKLYYYRNSRDRAPAANWIFGYDEALGDIVKEVQGALDSSGLATAGAWPVHVGSVLAASSMPWRDFFVKSGLVPVEIIKRTVRYQGRYNLAQIGIDRLALIESARDRYPATAQVIVSSGTALTVDYLNGQGVHEGGWILPGLQTSLDALASATGRLPALSMAHYQPGHGHCFPTTTEEAMLSGAFGYALSFLERLLDKIEKSNGHAPQLRLTGGGVAQLEKAFAVSSEKDLLVHGLRMLVLGGYIDDQSSSSTTGQ